MTLEDIHDEAANRLQKKQPKLDAIYQDLPPAHQEYLSVLNDYEFYTSLDMIHEGQDPSVVTAAGVSEKLSNLVGEIDEAELQKRLQQIAQEHEKQDQGQEKESNTEQAMMSQTDD